MQIPCACMRVYRPKTIGDSIMLSVAPQIDGLDTDSSVISWVSLMLQEVQFEQLSHEPEALSDARKVQGPKYFDTRLDHSVTVSLSGQDFIVSQ